MSPLFVYLLAPPSSEGVDELQRKLQFELLEVTLTITIKKNLPLHSYLLVPLPISLTLSPPHTLSGQPPYSYNTTACFCCRNFALAYLLLGKFLCERASFSSFRDLPNFAHMHTKYTSPDAHTHPTPISRTLHSKVHQWLAFCCKIYQCFLWKDMEKVNTEE